MSRYSKRVFFVSSPPFAMSVARRFFDSTATAATGQLRPIVSANMVRISSSQLWDLVLYKRLSIFWMKRDGDCSITPPQQIRSFGNRQYNKTDNRKKESYSKTEDSISCFSLYLHIERVIPT